MQHHFNTEIAKKYGVYTAIFLDNLSFWLQKNIANKKNLHDGRYWTYNSSEALSILFPYWSTDQIDRLIKKCVSLGLVLIDNFNEKTYDRTRWYGLTDLGLELCNITIPRNHGMDSEKTRNEDREIAEPIPDNKPDIKTDKIKSYSASEDARSKSEQEFDIFWKHYPKDRNKARAKQIWKRKYQEGWLPILLDDIEKRLRNDSQWRHKQYIPYASSYLLQERWNDEISEISTQPKTNSKYEGWDSYQKTIKTQGGVYEGEFNRI